MHDSTQFQKQKNCQRNYQQKNRWSYGEGKFYGKRHNKNTDNPMIYQQRNRRSQKK